MHATSNPRLPIQHAGECLPDLYMHMTRLRMYDYLTRLRSDKELPPANKVERALWKAIDEHWWKKRVSESFRAVMRAIIERAFKRGYEMETYAAMRIFNRSYIDHTNEAIRRSRRGRFYVEDKLQWISYKRVQQIEEDWSLAISLVRTRRYRIDRERYVMLVVSALRNHTTAGGRANSEPRIRKKKEVRRERFLSDE